MLLLVAWYRVNIPKNGGMDLHSIFAGQNPLDEIIHLCCMPIISATPTLLKVTHAFIK